MSNNTTQIPIGWKITTLGEVAETICSGGTPLTNNPDFYNGTIPWLRTQEVDFNYIYDTEKKITEKGLKNSSAKWISEEAVVIAMYGNSAGRVAFTKIKLTTNQACCNLMANINEADPRFIYFNLKNRYSEIEGLANGGAQQNLNVGILKNLKILLPPLPEQKAIADVLSSFDNKIELLREQNKTLETIAQTIFNEWFVRFNFPDENGKPYQASGGKMIDSELGPIPEGWRVGKYENLVDVFTGKGIRSEDLCVSGSYKVIGANGMIGKTDKYLYDEDLILTGRVGTLGLVNFSRGKVWISDNVLISRPLDKEKYYFAYFHLRKMNFESLNRGSTQPLITQTDLKNVELICPNNETLVKWHNIVTPLFSKLFKNSSQIQTLSTLRDELLPKLVKGELRAMK
jgi:type I restriction enzyme S subunit